MCFFLIGGMPSALPGQEWSLTGGTPWARDAGRISKSTVSSPIAAENGLAIEHTGTQDWALSEGKRISVKPGDVIEMKAELKSDGSNGRVGISVVSRKQNGDVVAWTYATREKRGGTPKTTLRSAFMVPPGVDTIEPRIVGFGPSTTWIGGFSLKKIDHRNLDSQSEETVELSNRFLKIQVNPSGGFFSVTDRRTGRTWKPGTEIKRFTALPRKTGKGTSFSLVNMENLLEYAVSVELETDRPEVIVRLDGAGSMDGPLSYPPAFASESGDRLIIPMNEGISYPVERTGIKVRRLIAYGGHGIGMAFWGQLNDADGSGMMAILETSDDAALEIVPVVRDDGGTTRLQVAAVWEASHNEFRYPRSIRFVFFDQGGHVAVCKRYRDHAKQTGLFKPFSEKVKKNPNIDKLLGAANIWYMGGRKLDIARELKEIGIDRILWSSGGGAKHLEELNKMDNVLTSRYDIYQDIMDPTRFGEVAHVHGDWTTEAWPHDINWIDPRGTWRKGWSVTAKDKTKPRIPCAVICDAKAVPYARKRITKELETKPYTARFIDTTVAAPWFECYHPDHPMTRSDSRKHKMELLKLIGDLGLVCGSETGHDASVPYCDYFEGMLSLGPYRVFESGRNMQQIIDEVPPQITDFQVNPALRLPLWELVYHDCVVAQWYWGDYNNKLPKVWRQRDLFNALYGTPPMYLFTDEVWKQHKERIGESFKTAGPVARATAYAEMTDHRILSDDRLVQQTVFSNGVVVTVNFSEKEFKLPDGSTVGAMDWIMIQAPPVDHDGRGNVSIQFRF